MVEGEDVELVARSTRRRGEVQVISRSSRSGGAAPLARKVLVELEVGKAGEQPWRDTTSAPQALPSVALRSSRHPAQDARRNPDRNASPAPSVLSTSTGNPATSSGAPRAAAPCTRRAALDDDRRIRGARFATATSSVRVAAGDADLLLGADDQVAGGSSAAIAAVTTGDAT